MSNAEAARRELEDTLEALVTSRTVPGGVAVVASAREVLFEQAFGVRTTIPRDEPATPDTLYDLASLTKPLVTATLFLRLRARARVRFDLPVTDLVPELRGGPWRQPTLGELLAHSGGMPVWEPLYAVAPGGAAERARWLGTHREEPGRAAVYGCPGYQVLGLALERLTGLPLPRLAREELLPDGDDVVFPVPARLTSRCAPTEIGNARERELAGERAKGYDGFRTDLIRGEVHDHCAYTLGGAAGNSGLFATARGVARLAQRFLQPDAYLAGEDLDELSRPQAPLPSANRASELRTWGFQLARSASSPAGAALSDRAFGHAGFTGTSLFVDPDRGTCYVLLCNRVHPRWTDHPFHQDRTRFHAAAAEFVEACVGHGA